MPKIDIGQILSRNLEPYLRERGAQARLAERTGLSPGTVSEIARGLISPQLDTLQKIAEYLGVGAWELILDCEEARRRAWSKIMSHDPKPEDFLPPANRPLSGKVRELRPVKGVAARRKKKRLPPRTSPQP